MTRDDMLAEMKALAYDVVAVYGLPLEQINDGMLREALGSARRIATLRDEVISKATVLFADLEARARSGA